MINENITGLTNLLSSNDWFDSVGTDQFGKLVVFVHFYNLDMMNAIPDEFNNKRVVWQFATSKSEAVKLKYATPIKLQYGNVDPVVKDVLSKIQQKTLVALVQPQTKIIEKVLIEKEPDINFLISEIARLKKILKVNLLLSDLLFEAHDGPDAKTNFKVNYVEVYDDVLDLYEEFGFDLIYENLYG